MLPLIITRKSNLSKGYVYTDCQNKCTSANVSEQQYPIQKPIKRDKRDFMLCIFICPKNYVRRIYLCVRKKILKLFDNRRFVQCSFPLKTIFLNDKKGPDKCLTLYNEIVRQIHHQYNTKKCMKLSCYHVPRIFLLDTVISSARQTMVSYLFKTLRRKDSLPLRARARSRSGCPR